MLNLITQGAEHIYLACGPTDFRKQIEGLAAVVSLRFVKMPVKQCGFLVKSAFFKPVQGRKMLILRTKNGIIKTETIKKEATDAYRARISGAA